MIDDYSKKKDLNFYAPQSPEFLRLLIREPKLFKIIEEGKDENDYTIIGYDSDNNSIYYYGSWSLGFENYKIENLSKEERTLRLKSAIAETPEFLDYLNKNVDIRNFLTEHPDGGIKVFVLDSKIWTYQKGEYISFVIGEKYNLFEKVLEFQKAIDETPTFQKYLKFDSDLRKFIDENPDGGINKKSSLKNDSNTMYATITQDHKIFVYEYGNTHCFIIGK